MLMEKRFLLWQRGNIIPLGGFVPRASFVSF